MSPQVTKAINIDHGRLLENRETPVEWTKNRKHHDMGDVLKKHP